LLSCNAYVKILQAYVGLIVPTYKIIRTYISAWSLGKLKPCEVFQVRSDAGSMNSLKK